jgi:hypothetical protein
MCEEERGRTCGGEEVATEKTGHTCGTDHTCAGPYRSVQQVHSRHTCEDKQAAHVKKGFGCARVNNFWAEKQVRTG